jgi:hypothetical protein
MNTTETTGDENVPYGILAAGALLLIVLLFFMVSGIRSARSLQSSSATPERPGWNLRTTVQDDAPPPYGDERNSRSVV